jgi:hypothetical protein
MRVLVAAVLAAAVAVPAAAQSLAEIAEKTRREREAKKKSGGSAKVITESELRGAETRGTYSSAAGEPTPEASPVVGQASPAPGTPGAAAQRPKTEEELATERQAEWRKKLAEAQEDVSRWAAEVNRLQDGLNDATLGFYGPARANRANALAEAQKNLAAAQASVESLTTEGRRNGWR